MDKKQGGGGGWGGGGGENNKGRGHLEDEAVSGALQFTARGTDEFAGQKDGGRKKKPPTQTTSKLQL